MESLLAPYMAGTSTDNGSGRSRISLIVAMAKNRVIGCNGSLPWRMSADLKRFKALTMGCPLIMGRKTFESIGRPLPGRRSIVLSSHALEDFKLRQVTQRGTTVLPAVVYVNSLSIALDEARLGNPREVFVIGGGMVFEETIAISDRMYISRILAEVKGDTRFPKIDLDDWELVRKERFSKDEKNEYAHEYCIYDRLKVLFP